MLWRRYRAEVLTPVHVGTGKVVLPEEYVIDEGGRLIRFRPEYVLRSWSEGQRRHFEELVAKGDLTGAWEQLKKGGLDQPQSWRYKLFVGKEALEKLGAAADPTRFRGGVYCLPWSQVAPRVIIPGSAIKGAIRTALLNACVNHPPASKKAEVARRIEEAKRAELKEAWQTVESVGFQYPRSETEKDPMRLIHVADAEVRPEAVRVDRAVIVNRRGEEARARAIQMHVERLVSRADGGAGAEFGVRIALEEERARDPRIRELLSVFFDWNFLGAACNSFFLGRWQEEAAAFRRVKEAVGERLELREGEILLRVGRFCHFESLSVDGYREGWDAQRERPIRGMGSSRTLCHTATGGLAPFGWIVLRPEDEK